MRYVRNMSVYDLVFAPLPVMDLLLLGLHGKPIPQEAVEAAADQHPDYFTQDPADAWTLSPGLGEDAEKARESDRKSLN